MNDTFDSAKVKEIQDRLNWIWFSSLYANSRRHTMRGGMRRVMISLPDAPSLQEAIERLKWERGCGDVGPAQERIERVNALIETIASCGRNFFRYETSPRGPYRFAKAILGQDNKLYWEDEYFGPAKRICLQNGNAEDWGRKISHGSGVRLFIQALRDFILLGKPVPPDLFAHWGYEQSIKQVIEHARQLRIVEP